MTDNEKRAHDLACAVMSNNVLLKENTFRCISTSITRNAEKYKVLYEAYLKYFNEKFNNSPE